MSAADGKLIAFMAGTGRDDRGRTFEDVLSFSVDELEDVHDYIQWLFPLYSRSGANPSAPVLDRASAAAFRRNPALRRQLRRAFEMMLRFYGLKMTIEPDAVRVAPDDAFRERQAIWLNRGNHNFLRLTRILKCLSILHAAALSRALLVCLLDIATEYPGVISDEDDRVLAGCGAAVRDVPRSPSATPLIAQFSATRSHRTVGDIAAFGEACRRPRSR